ncbi:MAG: BamA/TamA family outer membrane protein [Chloroflexota bacterium]
MRLIYYYAIFTTAIIALSLPAFSQDYRIGSIFIERREVFEPADKDWFFAGNFLNKFHSTTRQYVVEDELLFAEGDALDETRLSETERNLRAIGIFTWARVELDSARDGVYDVYVITKDRWTLMPALLIGSQGGNREYGARLEERNLLGTGTSFTAEALYRTENDIGWQGTLLVNQRRLFRSDFSFSGRLLAHKYRTEQSIGLAQLYRTLETPNSYGVDGLNNYGKDFMYFSADSAMLIPFRERGARAWYSKAWDRQDRVFFTALAEVYDVKRIDHMFRRAYDNTGRVLLGFSSISQDFVSIPNVNSYYPEDANLGGWGSAILGKTISLGRGGENLYYLGGQGEISAYDGKTYLFAQVTGAGSFAGAESRYVYEEFLGLAFRRLTPKLTLASQVRQQTVWNWDAWRQLILDSETGLRGYDANEIVGDNRVLANTELRYFPGWNIFLFDLSGAAFWDIGSAWRRGTPFDKTQFHNSAGLGLRLHFTKSSAPEDMFRLDFAWNFDKNRFGGVVFTTRQMFSAYKLHEFRLPQIFGLEYDKE